MKKHVLIFMTLSLTLSAYSQEEVKIYDPTADAAKDVAVAIEKARETEKHVLVMVGGNWCSWCRRLNAFILDDPEIDSTLQSNFVWVKVNYSKENKNLDLLRDLGVPQRMGFPVILILDGTGTRLHTQNSWYLEEDKSYSKKKLLSFLKEWSFEALVPENHKDYRL